MGTPHRAPLLESPAFGLMFCGHCLEVLFEQGALLFHFVLLPTNYVASPDYSSGMGTENSGQDL